MAELNAAQAENDAVLAEIRQEWEDVAKAAEEATVANAQAALDSQLSYWENYNANLETLTAYDEGLTGAARENYDALLAYAQSGSEEAAGLANSIAEAIASGDEQAVTDLANTLSKISAQQEAAAAATADWQTNFTETMQGYEEDMLGIIKDMDMSEEAKASASATVSSYADEILAGKPRPRRYATRPVPAIHPVCRRELLL